MGILFGVLLSLLLIAHITILILIDTDRIEKEIISYIKSEFRRDTEISSTSIGLFTGLYLEEVKINDSDSFGSGLFLTANSIAVKVRLTPLLRGWVVPKKVILTDPLIIIKQNVSGELNVSDILHVKKLSRTSTTALHISLPTLPSAEMAIHSSPTLQLCGFPFIASSKSLFSGWKVELENTQFFLKRATIKFIKEKRRAKDPSKIKTRIQTLKNIDLKFTLHIAQGKGKLKIISLEVRHRAFSFHASGQLATDPFSAVVNINSGRFNLFDIQPRPHWLKHFKRGELKIENLTAELTAKEKSIVNGNSSSPSIEVNLKKLLCKLNGGVMKSDGKMNFSSGPPQFKIHVQCEDADLNPFLWRTRDDQTSLGGLISFTLDFEGEDPFNPGAWYKNITGGRKIQIHNGRFEHKVLLEILQLLETRVLSRALGISSLEENQTYEATCRFTFTKGKFYCKLDLNSKDITLSSKDGSWIGLDSKLKCLITVAIKGEEICKVKVKGSLDKPKVKLKSINETAIGKILKRQMSN